MERVKLQRKRQRWHGLNTIASVTCRRTNSEDAQSLQKNAPINFSSPKCAMLFESILLPRLCLWRKSGWVLVVSPLHAPPPPPIPPPPFSSFQRPHSRVNIPSIFFDNWLLLCHQNSEQAIKLTPQTNMDSNSVKLYSQALHYVIFQMNAISSGSFSPHGVFAFFVYNLLSRYSCTSNCQ